jgi:CHRD domain
MNPYRLLFALIGTSVLAVPVAASPVVYTATLAGTNENPANASPGVGTAVVTFDATAMTMEVNVSFSGLLAGNTAAHIHCCGVPPTNVGVATTTPTFTGFPGGVTAGTYDNTFDMTLASSYNPAFITNNGGTVSSAFSVLSAGLAAGQAYLNIHSSAFGGGEIRGFLVPLPGAFGLMSLALAGIGALARRRN